MWCYLYQETRSQEVFAAVLQPMLYIIQSSTREDYETRLHPSFRQLFTAPKSIQASVVLLENLHIILEKVPTVESVTQEVLPILYNSFESNTIQIQTAAFVAVPSVVDFLEDAAIRRTVLPKLKLAFKNTTTDHRILMKALVSILDRLEKQQIIDDVLPLLREVNLQEPEIIVRVVSECFFDKFSQYFFGSIMCIFILAGIYRLMLSDKKYGLTVTMLATRVMPSLLPQTVNPGLKLEHFTSLIEVLHEMLTQIDR